MSTENNEYKLVVATKEQQLKCWKTIGPYWGKGINESEFIARETLLTGGAFGKENLTQWVLIDSNDKMLTFCESYQRNAIYKNENEIEKRKVYSICSVFTPEEYRGNGYASKMFQLLVNELDKNDTLCSVLYSDVGQFYERFGYKEYDPYHLELDSNVDNLQLDENIHYLTEGEIKKISELDLQLIERELKESEEKSIMVIEPNFDCYEWHFTRSRYYANYKKKEIPTIFGSIYQGEELEFLIWTYDFNENELVILRHRIQNHGDELLNSALLKLKEMKFTKIVAWNLYKKDVGEYFNDKVVIVKRDVDSLPYATFPQLKNQKDYPHWWYIQKYNWV
ncbi:hypothetical protein K502DRAFT_323883 [Neoconidiobolus thromboides FSU 785]|nr:hypothetical protein K502DRAFT_323883 [Neoconidiobolus thromboides FSU 785]